MRQGGQIIITLGISLLLAFIATQFVEAYPQTVIALTGINVILAISLNLVNGFTGQFSMGHAGFMAKFEESKQ